MFKVTKRARFDSLAFIMLKDGYDTPL